jgi:hypothetical protein
MAEHTDDRDLEERIRGRAYQLWERDDVRKKHPDEYWEAARRDIEAEDARTGASASPAEDA